MRPKRAVMICLKSLNTARVQVVPTKSCLMKPKQPVLSKALIHSLRNTIHIRTISIPKLLIRILILRSSYTIMPRTKASKATTNLRKCTMQVTRIPLCTTKPPPKSLTVLTISLRPPAKALPCPTNMRAPKKRR